MKEEKNLASCIFALPPFNVVTDNWISSLQLPPTSSNGSFIGICQRQRVRDLAQLDDFYIRKKSENGWETHFYNSCYLTVAGLVVHWALERKYLKL